MNQRDIKKAFIKYRSKGIPLKSAVGVGCSVHKRQDSAGKPKKGCYTVVFDKKLSEMEVMPSANFNGIKG